MVFGMKDALYTHSHIPFKDDLQPDEPVGLAQRCYFPGRSWLSHDRSSIERYSKIRDEISKYVLVPKSRSTSKDRDLITTDNILNCMTRGIMECGPTLRHSLLLKPDELYRMHK